MQSCLCTAQVRCDVVSFDTISIRHEQVVKQNINACMQGMSAMCTHSGTICRSLYDGFVRRKVLRDVTRNFNRPFGNLPRFEYRRVIHGIIVIFNINVACSHIMFLVRVPFLIFSQNYDESVVQTSAIATCSFDTRF